MKKIVSIYIFILVAIFVLFSLLDLRGEYVVEKKLWHINKEYIEASQDPTSISDKTFDHMADKYQRVANQFPDSPMVPGIYMLKARVYALKRDYTKAREMFQYVIDTNSEKPEFLADAKASIAKTYELEDNWDEANKIYKAIMKDFPLTSVGLGTPMYLANYYQSKNDFRSTMIAYDEAVEFYKRISAENPNSAVEFNSLRFLANCYLAQNRWADAVESLKQVLFKYPTQEYLTIERADLMIKTINMIVATKLNDYDIAINMYQEFIVKYPQHPLNNALQRMIDSFNTLKERDVKLSVEE